jgi:Uma2 family endonuclease
MASGSKRVWSPSHAGEPAWEIARLFPDQGQWSVEEYLGLGGNHLVEYSNGHVEVLPIPTTSHQAIVLFLYRLLKAFASPRDMGRTLVAPLRVRLGTRKFREPDIVFMLTEHAARIGEAFWVGADRVMEVVSAENRTQDLETKRREYARAGIPEYWIVDPREGRITVLVLTPGRRTYTSHGEFHRGDQATFRLLAGFRVDVAAALAAQP